MRHITIQLAGVFLGILCAGAISRADQLVLKDGTTLEGTVIPQGTNFWVKLADGTSKIIPQDSVDKRIKTAAPVTATPMPVVPKPDTGGGLEAIKHRAETSDSVYAALAIWQKYMAGNPAAGDSDAAKAELARWQKMVDEHAEKVGSKWLVGDELKAFREKLEAKIDEYVNDVKANRTIEAVKALEEIRKLYPNSFEANFLCGYTALVEHKDNDGIAYFETCVKLRPDDRPACSNLGIALFATKKDMERGMLLLYHVVDLRDTKQSAYNLVRACSLAPRVMESNAKLKPAFDAAKLLENKYHTKEDPDFQGRSFILLALQPPGGNSPTTRATPGMLSSGTGFIINGDGLILTNRHVVDGATSLMVHLDGDVAKVGQIVTIDKEQDLALVRIKSDKPLPTAQLAAGEKPNEGATCFVLGFPLIDRVGASIKVTQGIVSGQTKEALGADLIVDAKVNPGNSGGPLVDRHGHVVGIVTLKTRSATFEDSYGLAISTPHIAKFLEKNKVATTDASADSTSLTAEEVVAKIKPATVCIIATH